jgi:hypothetical protein
LAWGIALVLDQGELADPPIGLTQLDAGALGEPHQDLARPVQEPRVGREHHVLGLYRGVDDDAIEIGRLDRLGLGGDRKALLQQGLQLLLAHALTPARQRGAVEHQAVLEELLAAEELVIGVLHPALAQHLVGEIVGVLENGQARHQAGRQRRPARLVLVDRPELLLQERPVDRPRKPHQRMVHVDDRVQPGAQKIGLSAIASLLWLHRSLRSDRRNHDARFDGILKSKIASFWATKARKLAISKPLTPEKTTPAQWLGSSSRTTNYSLANAIAWTWRP